MQDFVRVFPDGLLIKEAQRILRQLADQADFEDAKALDKAAAWQLYLTTHPTGAHVERARERLTALEDLAFKNVLAARDARAGAEFLADFPDSPRREELAANVAKWEQSALVQEALAAISKGDCDRADSLLTRITDDAYRREIVDALETARDKQRWDAARKDDSIPSLKAYLEAHPKGRWVKDAQKRLMKLHAASEASEPRDWDTAWEAGTVAAWDQYLTAHPDSRRIDEARTCRQEAADFDVAGKANSSSMWRAFIKTWPEGRHRIDAEIRMRSASR
jgi:outer membrane protein assembly factor BamD (BamD/ComL family)